MAKQLRADARDNRALLLAAAREVFAADGPGAPLDRVARHAGVGNATMYRHFPNRRELLAAVYAGEVETLRTEGEALLSSPDPDEALYQWLRRFVEHVKDKRELALSISDEPGDREARFAEWHGTINATAAALAARARLAEDVEPLDLLLLATGIALSGAPAARTDHLLTLLRRGSAPA
ncbi:TetR/AcrR family transcriptional regulator [Amycolatopsis sp. NBC_01480]|jgi:AcrR family transcriptional regulator|uniref:TetR/AcrR family transcriptional regulator n=1 Tax=Amycolatopsis sp. NBC_01480 TaxID=2903562 RepID=UPI002E2C3BB4|nr:helix-turn-helix domain-containing protein [Amycolatopsis sp. NBC_01480]